MTSCVSIKPVNKNLVTFLTDHCPFLLNIEFLLMSLELRPFPDYRRRYNTAFLLFLFVKFITKINITPKKSCPGMLNTIVISEEHFYTARKTYWPIDEWNLFYHFPFKLFKINQRTKKSVQTSPLAGPVHSMSAYNTGFT